jgi:hypothetical protein
MPQAVGRKAFGDAGPLSGLPAGQPNGIDTDGNVGAHSLDGTREKKGGGLHPAPVDAQGLQ